VFFGLFSLPQNPKMAKKNIEFAVFSKIETRLKALYVRLKGIPEGGLKAL